MSLLLLFQGYISEKKTPSYSSDVETKKYDKVDIQSIMEDDDEVILIMAHIITGGFN